MSDAERSDRLDRVIAVSLALGYLVLLLAGVRSLGYTRDEGFYMQCAKGIEAWFSRIAEDGFGAFEQSSRDRAFACTREHPGLMKTLFAASHALFHERFELFRESGTAYR